ncbi:MAG: PEP/pyruvate-binding domain-containing protein, partial [Calditrichaeota bacterium]|nr:PEP/pyruvate-binding domain-containing protein [Calditrichota bacterium]
MTNSANPQLDELIRTLKERAKELNCLYVIEEILDNPDKDISLMFCKICEAIPPGWQYPDICRAVITYNGEQHQSDDFELTEWVQHANIVMHDETVGKISVYYLEDRPVADEGPFLKEERKLIGTIANRLGIFLLHNRLKKVFEDGKTSANSSRASWWVILDLLRRTDPRLLMRITRKMTNYMGWQGVEEAEQLLSHFGGSAGESTAEDDPNRPHEKKSLQGYGICEQVFEVASNNLNQAEIYSNIQKWIQEDKTGFLVNILENSGSTLAEIADALERFVHMGTGESELPLSREKGFRVSLIRRLLTDQTDFIKIAKHFVQTSDFYELLNRVIYPAGSHGKLGGKGSGLLLAGQILKKFAKDKPEFENIKIPKTWYLTSDTILSFMNYNNLEEIVEQKYKEIGIVRLEYPFIVQLFKNSQFPPEIVHGLSMALEDLGETPLIVRSSSLLEDRMGTAFAGKYKSLFIANQGTKEERLAALLDAIAEVYASTFSPDPIEYRMERELLDYHEEMGILIQEVVGQKIGPYYLPSFSGVGFSRNEYRWSSRIQRDDGVVRIVPGLGTRAVDRLSDDYPIMLAPGQPGLRVNVSLDEKIRYSPKKVDVIHLEHNQFETVELSRLLREYGEEYPAIDRIVSIMRNERMVLSSALGIDFKKDHSVVTFDGLIERTGFISQIHSVLKTLESTLETPIDIEFASDGKDL